MLNMHYESFLGGVSVPNVSGVDEASMRQIVREEAKAAAKEAVQEYVNAKVQMLAPTFNLKLAGGARDPVMDLASAAAEFIKPKGPVPGQRSCSFCGLPETKVKKLIGSPHGIHICDSCLGIAQAAAK
jgi:hypothetical protein